MMTVALALPAKLPSGQRTTPLSCAQFPWLGAAEMKVTRGGSRSSTTTLEASPVLLFRAVSV
jgi:hypothetical protein